MSADPWMTVYCLECKETTTGNGWGCAPETGAVICHRCRGIMTKVIEPADFVKVPWVRKTMSALRMIATVAELDALPEDSVILDDGWYPKVKGEDGKWWRPDCTHGIAAEGTVLPTRLLWTPEDEPEYPHDRTCFAAGD